MITYLQWIRYVPMKLYGYRMCKSKSSNKTLISIPIFDSGFIVSNKITDSLMNFNPIDWKTTLLTFKFANKLHFNCPCCNQLNKNEKQTKHIVDDYWDWEGNYLGMIPSKHTFFFGDFNSHIIKKKKRRKHYAHMRTNRNGEN